MREETFVTTDCDLWNSADEAHFFVAKGQVKPLPEYSTPIIEDALDQGLLREATEEELSKYQFELDMEEAIKTRQIKPGKNYKDTVDIYQKYVKNKEAKKMTEEEPKVETEEKTEEVIPEPEVPKPEVPEKEPEAEEPEAEEPEEIKEE